MFAKKSVCFLFLLCALQIFCGCTGNTTEETITLVVHADSLSATATKASDDVTATLAAYFSDELINVSSVTAASAAVRARQKNAENIARAVLKRNGCGYAVCVTLTSGVLSVTLGVGNGKAAQSALYPQSNVSPEGVVYRSIIAEWLSA